MSRKKRVGQSIKACGTGGTRRALPGGCCVITAALDALGGLTRWARDAPGPAQRAARLITLPIIAQMLALDLPRWTPVRSWDMGVGEGTPSSPLRPWNPT